MAALIVRSMSWDGESWTNDFTDRNGLQAELWQAIGTLQHYGVASGYGDGTFGPNDLVTRAQTIAFITRAMVTQGYWQDQLGAPMPYTGVPAAHVTDLATFYHYTQALGGIPEAPVGSDAWNAPATRGWFAQALWRALDSQFGVDQIP
ncbi:MAG: S-layer homology domain-containing protein [Chloroflexia bacterium]